MADKKISTLTSASTPLAGTEVLPIVQSGATVKVSVADLTTGRSAAAKNFVQSNSDGSVGYTGFSSGGTQALHTYSNTAGVQIDAYQSVSGWPYTKTTDFVANADTGAWSTYRHWTVPTGGTPAVAYEIDIYQNILVNAGNLIQGTAAKGVNFTANTPAAGMTSQLLNWYEEGTWTPSIGGTATYNLQAGRYTRVGRLVTVTGILNIATLGTGVTTRIYGLPFTAGGTSGRPYGGSVSYFANVATAVTSIYLLVDPTTSYIDVRATTAASTTVSTVNIFNNSTILSFVVQYEV